MFRAMLLKAVLAGVMPPMALPAVPSRDVYKRQAQNNFGVRVADDRHIQQSGCLVCNDKPLTISKMCIRDRSAIA